MVALDRVKHRAIRLNTSTRDMSVVRTLNAFFVAFHYARMHFDAVADFEIGHFAFELFLFNGVDNRVHKNPF